MDETYSYAHHFEEIYTPLTEDGVYMYYNYLSERQNSVDYGYLSESLTSKLSLSLTNAALSYSGTLSGLMASMSSPAPSFLSVMTCMSILNIENMSVSYKSNQHSFFRAGIETESDLYIDINAPYNNPQNFYFRQIKLEDTDDFQRNYVIKKYSISAKLKCRNLHFILKNDVSIFILLYSRYQNCKKPQNQITLIKTFLLSFSAYHLGCLTVG